MYISLYSECYRLSAYVETSTFNGHRREPATSLPRAVSQIRFMLMPFERWHAR